MKPWPPRHKPLPRSLHRPLSAACLLGTLSLTGPAPAQNAQDIPGSPGFYPTGEEVDLLGGESRDLYGRYLGGLNIGGPDAGSLTASGLWHQDPEPTDSFYERHPGFFKPLDSALGLFAPREVVMMESDEPRRSRLYGYADPGFLMTRDFNPDLATLKLGPLYLDLLRLSGTVLYTDYSGWPRLPEDDGWLSAIYLDLRAAARLTQNLYLTLSGSVYFLPDEGEAGFYLGDGTPTFLRLAYESNIGSWNYIIFDEFTAHHRLSEIFDEVEHDEISKAGRYRFGRLDTTHSGDYFDSDEMFFVNQLGAAFYGPLGDLFEAKLSLEHFDYWDTLDFDHLRNWDRAVFHVDYTGFDSPVVPYFEYQLTAVDDWDILHHSTWLGARAHIAENLRFDGRVGYYWSQGTRQDYDRPIGEIGLIHDLNESTTHSLYAGVREHIWEDSEDLLASYVRYSLAHSFGPRLRGTAFVQFSDLENLDGEFNDRDGWSAGATLSAYLTESTYLTLGVHYDEWDYAKALLVDQTRWIYRASLHQRLLPYLFAKLTYQYEDYDTSGPSDYTEHLCMFTMTYLF